VRRALWVLLLAAIGAAGWLWWRGKNQASVQTIVTANPPSTLRDLVDAPAPERGDAQSASAQAEPDLQSEPQPESEPQAQPDGEAAAKKTTGTAKKAAKKATSGTKKTTKKAAAKKTTAKTAKKASAKKTAAKKTTTKKTPAKASEEQGTDPGSPSQ